MWLIKITNVNVITSLLIQMNAICIMKMYFIEKFISSLLRHIKVELSYPYTYRGKYEVIAAMMGMKP